MHVGALKSLEQPVQHWDTILVYIIAKKLDKGTRLAWERTLENEEIPDFQKLIAFLNKQSRGEDCEKDYPQAARQGHDKNV